jgi:glutamyl-tRNA reductase
MITYAGMSHHTAPVEMRERLALDTEALPDVLRRAQETFGAGAAIVGTCNRLELYLGGHHEPGPVLGFLRREVDVDADTAERYFRVAHGPDAVRHLYRVSSGLDSMVLGETEILGQVRTAFATTVEAGTDNHVISRLFHTAIRTGRKARAQTAISLGALSVSSIAAQQARALFPDFASARVLIVGAGEAGRLAAEALAAQGPGEIVVTNRTHERATQLARGLGGVAVPFEKLHDALRGADVVVGATGAPEPLVSTEDIAHITEARSGRPLLIIDIGVPRDFPGAVQHLDGVAYHDLDALQAVTERNNEARQSEVAAVEDLIDVEVGNFQEWWDQLQIVPTITALHDRADALRRIEVAKTMRRLRLDADERAQVEDLIDVLSRSIVNQVLADPIAVLRERGDRDSYVDALRTLFRLQDGRGDA